LGNHHDVLQYTGTKSTTPSLLVVISAADHNCPGSQLLQQLQLQLASAIDHTTCHSISSDLSSNSQIAATNSSAEYSLYKKKKLLLLLLLHRIQLTKPWDLESPKAESYTFSKPESCSVE
jgi:hypothetical protein